MAKKVEQQVLGMKLAAIDIGSNSVRLMLARVYEQNGEPNFVKESLVRIPIRLGEDVFAHGKIQSEKIESLTETMLAFKHLIAAYKAVGSIACATSAMREAENGRQVVAHIKRKTGINIELIEGKREASIIYASQISALVDAPISSIFVDVGGGSTEVTLMSRDHITESASFKIGTVRMLQRPKQLFEFDRMKAWIKAKVTPNKPQLAIGTGGTINNIFRLSGKKPGKLLSVKEIVQLRKFLNSFTIEERIRVIGLRPDRADVIVEAADIYLQVLKWAGVKRMFVPIRGLSDGLIQVVYEEIQSKKNRRKRRR